MGSGSGDGRIAAEQAPRLGRRGHRLHTRLPPAFEYGGPAALREASDYRALRAPREAHARGCYQTKA
jgi:hypothetical protein